MRLLIGFLMWAVVVALVNIGRESLDIEEWIAGAIDVTVIGLGGAVCAWVAFG